MMPRNRLCRLRPRRQTQHPGVASGVRGPARHELDHSRPDAWKQLVERQCPRTESVQGDFLEPWPNPTSMKGRTSPHRNPTEQRPFTSASGSLKPPAAGSTRPSPSRSLLSKKAIVRRCGIRRGCRTPGNTLSDHSRPVWRWPLTGPADRRRLECRRHGVVWRTSPLANPDQGDRCRHQGTHRQAVRDESLDSAARGSGAAGKSVMEFAANVSRLKPVLRRAGSAGTRIPGDFSQRFEDQIEALLEARPPVLSFVFGIPSREILTRLAKAGNQADWGRNHSGRAVRWRRPESTHCFVWSDAGGHRPSFLKTAEESLTGTLALIPQVVDAVNTPIIAAGGIGDERGIVAAFVLGAEAAQLGTVFLATHESGASEVHKAELVKRVGPLYRVDASVFWSYGTRHSKSIHRGDELPRGEVPPYPIHSWFTRSIRGGG